MIGAIDLGDASSASAVCLKAREYGLLTRPIRNTIVLMPPLCLTAKQSDLALTALEQAIEFVITRKKQYTKAVGQTV
jgi:adenosylmethionine-8-amino-7-oxononanoate aminotransferase